MVGLEDDSDQVSSERSCGSYSLSADISESESCSSTLSFPRRRFDGCPASSSITSSPGRDGASARFRLSLSTLNSSDAQSNTENLKLQRSNSESKEMEMMKERFSKLLLGEDMSGSGKGVCTALAISNAITNLSASVFGELWKLKPLAPQKKAMWRREMEWLLCICDSIVEMVPTVQQFPGGGAYEVMTCRPRSDLYINLPALKKLDAMLLSKLDSFQETEFWYMDRGITVNDGEDYDGRAPSGRLSVRHEDKWWLPCPKVEPSGLSEGARKALQNHRDRTSQMLKAAMAINSSVLSEMEIPSAYIDSLPKNGKDCLGETLYRCITAQKFCPEDLLDLLNISTEHVALDTANRIEAAVNVWKLKDWKKHGRAKNNGKHNILAKRAEALFACLRRRNPGLPQTALDMSKIQYNKDVGQAILESYSRVLESLAFNIIARIDDVVFVDDETNKCFGANKISIFRSGGLPIQKRISPSPFSIHRSPFATPVPASPLTLPKSTVAAPEDAI